MPADSLSYWGGVASFEQQPANGMCSHNLQAHFRQGNCFRSGEYLLLLLYLLNTVAISMVLSSIFKTRIQLQAFTPLFAIGTSFLGGCFWPLSDLPRQLQSVAMFTPQGLVLEDAQADGANRRALLCLCSLPGSFVIPLILLGKLYKCVKNNRY